MRWGIACSANLEESTLKASQRVQLGKRTHKRIHTPSLESQSKAQSLMRQTVMDKLYISLVHSFLFCRQCSLIVFERFRFLSFKLLSEGSLRTGHGSQFSLDRVELCVSYVQRRLKSNGSLLMMAGPSHLSEPLVLFLQCRRLRFQMLNESVLAENLALQQGRTQTERA